MINRTLHALTNRTGPFNTPGFMGDSNFHPKKVTTEERSLRRKLFLDLTDTDFYVRKHLALIDSFPELGRQLQDEFKTYRIQDFLPRGISMFGGRFVSTQSIQGRFTDVKPTELPVGLTYFVGHNDNNSVVGTCKETGIRVTMSCVITQVGDETWLRPGWVPSMPFEGPMSTTQTWEQGSQIEIHVEPSSFPYQLMIDRLKGDPYLMTVLIQFSMVDEYVGAQDPAEKLAIALSCLALNNTSVY